ncbi:hypothetical protein [Streptomyces sp. NPDC092903]|uniref:hypothetical protein n=1 Tax=Streptomyces sp. NPDC092903 TaxID=3366017 RepID=UPI003808AA1A
MYLTAVTSLIPNNLMATRTARCVCRGGSRWSWTASDCATATRPPPRRIRLPRPARDHGPGDASAYAAAALRGELEAVASARAGRNDQLNRAGFRLGQLVGAGLLQHDEVHHALTDAAELAGIDPGEAKAQSTLRRALQAGIRSPRTIPSPGARS